MAACGTRRCYRKYYIAFALILFIGVLLFGKIQRSILFPTDYVHVAAHAPTRDGLEVHLLKDGATRVEYFFLKSYSSLPKSGVVFFAHGNGESIDNWVHGLDEYRKIGYHVILVEYRGYGRSTGSPSQKNITKDYIRAFDEVAAREDVDPDNIIFHGRSLGGGVVGSLALHRKPTKIVLESTFTSVDDMADSIFPLASKLVVDSFRTIDTVRDLNIPILVFHGTEDEVIPVDHGKRLAAESKNGKLVLYPAGHNNFPPDRTQYWEEISKFLNGNP